MYDEKASKFSTSSVSSGGLLFSSIYLRNVSTVSNVNISGADGADASGAETIKPLTVISMSSRVSENIWCRLSISFCKESVVMPMPPIHTVSFAPMASNEIGVLMRGFGFTVYPADSNISRSSGLFDDGCDGVDGAVDITGATGAVVGAANVWASLVNGVPRFRRGGRARLFSGICGAGDCCVVVGT